MSQIAANHRQHIYLKDLKDQLSYYRINPKTTKITSKQKEIELDYIISTTAESSKKLDNLLRDVQWLAYLNKNCSSIK